MKKLLLSIIFAGSLLAFGSAMAVPGPTYCTDKQCPSSTPPTCDPKTGVCSFSCSLEACSRYCNPDPSAKAKSTARLSGLCMCSCDAPVAPASMPKPM